MKKIKDRLFGIIFCLSVIIGVSSINYIAYCYNKDNSSLYQQEESLISEISYQNKDLKAKLFKASELLNDTSEEDVLEISVIGDLKNAIEVSTTVCNSNSTEVIAIKGYQSLNSLIESNASLISSIENNNSLLKNIESSIIELNKATSEVNKSIEAKKLQVAKDNLSSLLAEFQELYESSEGKVADDSVRSNLKELLDNQDTVLNSSSIKEVEEYTTSLVNCQSEVEASIKKQQEIIAAEQKRKSEAYYSSREEAESASQSGGSVRQNSDGTWYVDYSSGYHSYSFGSGVYEWEDGYYVAHSNNSNGSQIASKPNTVVVDGITYQYVSSITVPPGTTWQDVEGFVHANGGIGFQTCQSDGNYLITHYEPI